MEYEHVVAEKCTLIIVLFVESIDSQMCRISPTKYSSMLDLLLFSMIQQPNVIRVRGAVKYCREIDRKKFSNAIKFDSRSFSSRLVGLVAAIA